MEAGLTGRIEKFIPFEVDFEVLSFDDDPIALFPGIEDFSGGHPLNLSSVDHPLAGNADQKESFWFESSLSQQSYHRATIAPFDHQTHFETAELVEIGGQVRRTERVPYQLFCLFRGPGKERGGPKGKRPPAKSDHKVYVLP
jgi:hypothetical protein